MAIIGIVAVDRRGAIGRGGSVPWHYPADMRFFKRQTTGHACVMGRRTWLSLKKPLTGRLNIVMSRHAEVEPQEGVILLRDRLCVLSLKDYLACDLFVIGGEQIYRTFQSDIDMWLVTEIPETIEDADTHMPPDYLEGFRPSEQLELDDGLKVTIFERI